jgi:hypothetical protein
MDDSNDDTRVFVPYNIKGNLILASPDRFLASTETPLPEGVCGGPVIDNNGRVCGVVEGIIPTDHKETELAGAASFIPYWRIKEFVDFAEREMLAKIVPKTLFDKVVALKDGKALHEKDKSHNIAGDLSLKGKDQGITMDRAYQEMIQSIRQTHSPEQVEAIMGTVEREHEEVLDMIEREGGDLDEIIAKVRTKTRERQREILKEMESKDIEEAQIVTEEEGASAPK